MRKSTGIDRQTCRPQSHTRENPGPVIKVRTSITISTISALAKPVSAIRPNRFSERFSSSDLAGLKYVDGFGELPGLPGAAAEFAQDAPGLSWALARSPGPGSWA